MKSSQYWDDLGPEDSPADGLGPGARWFVGAPGEGGALELSPLGDPPLTAPVVLAFDHADVLRQAWPSE